MPTNKPEKNDYIKPIPFKASTDMIANLLDPGEAVLISFSSRICHKI